MRLEDYDLDDSERALLSIFPQNYKIILYGLNARGKEVYKYLQKYTQVNIVGLIDKNIPWLELDDKKISVGKVEKIASIEYDCILITVKTLLTAKDIRRDLLSMGIERGRIFWLGNLSDIYITLQYTFFYQQSAIGKEFSAKRSDLLHRKVIFIIDQAIPQPDTNAGDRHLYSYIKLYLAMGYHVIFFPHDQIDRVNYTANLRNLGAEVLVGFIWDIDLLKQWLIINGKNIDYVNLYRPMIASQYIALFRETTNAQIFYLPADLHYIRLERQSRLLDDKKILQLAAKSKRTEYTLIAASDATLVLGTFEEETLKKSFPEKNIVNIPIYAWGQAELSQMPAPQVMKNQNIIFVGGFKHLPNVDGIKWFIHDIFPLISENNKKVCLYVAGANPPTEIRDLASDDIIVTGYVSDERLRELYNQSRVALVPLRFGAGIKGKVLEGMFNGVPVVTTSVGAEGLTSIDKCLWIADDATNFAKAVNEFLYDDDLCLKYAVAGQDYIRHHFSIKIAEDIVSHYYK